MNVYRNITDLIGNTPMLELAALAKEKTSCKHCGEAGRI